MPDEIDNNVEDVAQQRFDSGGGSTDGESTESSETRETTKTTEEKVRDRTGRTFFVKEEVLKEIDSRYKQFDADFYEEHETDLPKSDIYYPALFRAIDWDRVGEEIDAIAEEMDEF